MNPMKILLIDDELSNVKMLEAMLKISGYQCDPYTNPKEAWLALSTRPEQYHLILADRIMPHLNALQLLELVKTNSSTSHIPLAVITGLAETEEKIDLFRAGVFDILLKPIDRDVLLALVKRALKPNEDNR